MFQGGMRPSHAPLSQQSECRSNSYPMLSHSDYDRPVVSGFGSFSCPTCGKPFPSLAYLQSHMYNVHTERRYLCVVCDTKFKRKYHLQRHLKTVHDLFQCPSCPKVLKIHGEYKTHILQCSGHSAIP